MPPPNRFRDKSLITDARHCATCGDTIDEHFFDYLFLRLGNTIKCRNCGNKSYIIAKETVVYWIAKLLAIIVAAFIAISMGLFVPMATYNADREEFYVSIWLFILGIALGIIVSRLILKAYNWYFGNSSASATDQSILDF